MATATVARIRRCVRDSEYAYAENPNLLLARPDAKPVGDDNFTVDSMFDNTAHAQLMTDEKFAFISSDRRNEAGECDVPLGIGTDIPIAPVLPKVLMVDSSRALYRVMLIKGLAVDRQSDRNSIEAVG